MPQVHWKQLDEDYIIDIYKEMAYYNFDFYNVYAFEDGSYKLVGNQNMDFKLENFTDLLKRHESSRIYSDFSIFFRIDDSDIRFYTDEIMLDEDTFEILKKAVDFCKEYWNASFKKKGQD